MLYLTKKINKTKKTPTYIILYLCTKNHDDMIYSSWDIECDRLKLVIMGHFLDFHPLKNPKNQNFEKTKKMHEIPSLYTCIPKNNNHIRYGSWDMEWETEFFVILGPFFAFLLPPFPPNNSENQNFVKTKKAPGDVIIFHMCTKNYNHMMYASWDMECDK